MRKKGRRRMEKVKKSRHLTRLTYTNLLKTQAALNNINVQNTSPKNNIRIPLNCTRFSSVLQQSINLAL